MQQYDPLTSYPFSKNRLMNLDWASLSYHQWFSMVSKKRTAYQFDIDTSAKEIAVWKSMMTSAMIKYIKIFNPMDIVFAMEGFNTWRKGVYSEYYEKNAVIRYDATGFYVSYDNQLVKLSKQPDGSMRSDKLKYGDSLEYLKVVEFQKLSPAAKKAITDALPSYKGNRKDRPWEFLTPKKVWTRVRDEFARELAPLFRGRLITLDEAEGDDVLFVSTRYNQGKYDSIVMITGDSDMNQLLDQKNLIIYNHRTEMLVNCLNPKGYLNAKVLSGDDSDNINGIVLPGKKQQLGPKTAQTLLDSVGNCYEAAKKGGWDKQYDRNRKLIDLEFVPTHVQRQICEMIDEPRPELAPFSAIYEIGVTERISKDLLALKEVGYYCVHPYESAKGDPDLFKDFLVSNSGNNW